jgi:hypothetical protein
LLSPASLRTSGADTLAKQDKSALADQLQELEQELQAAKKAVEETTHQQPKCGLKQRKDVKSGSTVR